MGDAAEHINLLQTTYTEIIQKWWNDITPRYRNRGNIAGGLVLLENLRDTPDLNIENHKTAGSDQLRNATKSNVQKILACFGEKRVLSQEAGRTNRGLMNKLAPLLDRLNNNNFINLGEGDRDMAIDTMQSFLADRAIDLFNSDKISFQYNPGISSRDIVNNILKSAQERQKIGQVAEYLVGAKLALRFPSHNIRNSASSAADEQTDEHGDFQINDCVFHVTASPNQGHYEKCGRNLSNGYRVFLLVPDDKLPGARQFIMDEIGEGVSVESIQSFVSQNIEELAEFAGHKVAENIKSLLDKYNERVDEVETDLSLQIEIPASLE